MNALERAIEVVGGVTRLAVALGLRQSVVSNWKRRGNPKGRVPADRCLAIEEVTAGAVTRHALRPDVFGAKPAKSNAKATFTPINHKPS